MEDEQRLAQLEQLAGWYETVIEAGEGETPFEVE